MVSTLHQLTTEGDTSIQRMTTALNKLYLSFCDFAYNFNIFSHVVQVLEMRIPFLLSSVKDFQQHVPNGQDSMVCFIFVYNH